MFDITGAYVNLRLGNNRGLEKIPYCYNRRTYFRGCTGMIESGIWSERKGHKICLHNFKLAGKGPLASRCRCRYNHNINKYISV